MGPWSFIFLTILIQGAVDENHAKSYLETAEKCVIAAIVTMVTTAAIGIILGLVATSFIIPLVQQGH